MNFCKLLVLLFLILLSGQIVLLSAAESPQKNIPPLDCLISTGDNLYLADFIPVDSPASINDTLDILKNVMGVRRLYWRGMQEVSLNRGIHNPYSPKYYRWFKWQTDLLTKVKTEELVFSLASKKGIEVWGLDNLAEFGGPADTNCYVDLPYCWTSKIRREHPEWAPIDKYGFRRQAGPLCLAYPDARKAIINHFITIAREKKYSGIALFTYSETFSQHFLDEFGFNEPIVKEYKRRYGKDIRNYDWSSRFATREQWYRLRGEYLTQFLRELRIESKKYNIKLGIFLNVMDPYMPQIWMSSKHGFPTMGHIYMDVDTWAREGLVDQFIVSGNAARDIQASTVAKMTWLCRKTGIEVSCWTSGPQDPVWKPLQNKGMYTTCYYGKDSHYFNGTGLPLEKVGILDTQGNLYPKMRFLSQLVQNKKSEIPVKKILPLLKNNNVIMRRLAIETLALSKDKSVIPEIEKMLFDSENGVRCQAVVALGTLNRPESARAIMNALAEHGTFMLQVAAVNTLRKMPTISDKLKNEYLNSKIIPVRLTMLRALWHKANSKDIPYLKNALSDKDSFCAYAAARAFGNINNNKEVINILIKAMDNKNPAVANRAAVSLGQLVRANSTAYKMMKAQIIKALSGMFSRMGDKAPSDLREWGYKGPGDVLYSINPEGRKILREFKNQTEDKLLSTRAWQSLWFHDNPGKGFWITEEYNERAFADRPLWMKKTHIYWMNQDFEDTRIFAQGVEKYFGKAKDFCGRWGNFSKKGPRVSQEVAASGRQSVKLICGGNRLSFRRNKTISSFDDYSISLDVYRKKNGSILFAAKNISSSKLAFALYISPEGILQQRKPAGKPFYLNTSLEIPENKWCNINLTISGEQRNMTLSIKPSGGPVQKSKINISMAKFIDEGAQKKLSKNYPIRCSYIIDRSIAVNCFEIIPQSPTGNIVFIDNVKVVIFK